VRGMLLVLVLALTSGCAAIGIEVIGSGKAEVAWANVNDFSVHHWQTDSNISAFEFSQARPEGALNATNQLVRLSSPSTNDIINLLGAPSEQGTSYLRYRTGKWAWHGIAIDLAIFPIPLTIPLMVPGGKSGHVDFVFYRGETRLVRYGALSKFYGYGASDKESGFYWGSEPGFWFNPNP